MVIYKYLKKKYLQDFKNNGSVRINTLYNLRSEHEFIRDEFEGSHKLKVGSNKKQLALSGKEFRNLMPSLRISKEKEKNVQFVLDVGTHINSNIHVSNAFVFCASMKLDKKLEKKLGYDSHYKILNPEIFAEILYSKLNEAVMIKGFKADAVKYADKELRINSRNKKVLSNNLNDFWEICFTKPIRFRQEREFRIVFVPEFVKEIKPIIITCPELRKYCSL